MHHPEVGMKLPVAPPDGISVLLQQAASYYGEDEKI